MLPPTEPSPAVQIKQKSICTRVKKTKKQQKPLSDSRCKLLVTRQYSLSEKKVRMLGLTQLFYQTLGEL